MNVVYRYVHANTFLELDAINLAVLVTVPQKAADNVGWCRPSVTAQHALHAWDGHVPLVLAHMHTLPHTHMWDMAV